jgi:purine nucleosidase
MHILVDSDPGMGTLNSDPEDSFAIAFAANSPEAELVAVTIVQGNVPLRHGFANAKHLFETLGLTGRVELAAGASQPLLGPTHRAEQRRWLEEKDQWLRLTDPIDPPYEGRTAVEVIRDAAMTYDDLVIAAIGPLTNIAMALTLHPEIRSRIASLVVMGGAYREEGNITPTTEFNFFMDPEAAQIVLDSGLKPILVGLDVCHLTKLTKSHVDANWSGSAFGSFVKESCEGWLDEMERAGRAGLHLFDSLTVATAVIPELMHVEPAWVDIDLSRGHAGGTSISWYEGGRAGWSRPTIESNAFVATHFDQQRFESLVEQRILRLL